MKILIVSDTHFGQKNMDKIVPFIKEEIDLIIHAGDNFRDSIYLKEKTGKAVMAVAGNCDYENVEEELEFEVDGLKFFLTHGHRYGVKYGLDTLASKARDIGADIAIFGHTHEKVDAIRGGVRLINPGSLSLPRDGIEKSFVVMDIDEGREEHRFLFL